MTSEQRMNDKINNALNGFTPVFRLVGPFLSFLILALGYMINLQIGELKGTLIRLEARIEVNTQTVQEAQLDFERRITWLEAQPGQSVR